MKIKEKQKILIVDDQLDNLLVLKAVLRELRNVETITAENGEAALEQCENNEFSVAILDVQMPGMDGYELALEMNKRFPGYETPIIFLSAIYTDDFHVAKGYSAGAVDFLSKPINNDILLSKIKVFLELDGYRRHLSEMLEEKTAEVINKQHACEAILEQKMDIFNAIDDMLVVIDQTHTILQANKATLQRYGELIIGEKCQKVFEEASLPPGEPTVFSSLAKDKSIHYKEPVKVSNGLILDVSIFPIRNTRDDFSKSLYVLRDITKKITLEEELRQSEKMRALGALAGGVAHDFNNQLTAIMGYATLLRKKINQKTPSIVKYIDIIMKSARISADLTKQLLAFSRKDVAEFVLLDIHEQIEEIVNLVTRTFHKSIRIEIFKKAESPIINGDASRLNNVLLNLCVNARDAMPEGGVLTLSTQNITIVDEQVLVYDGSLAPGEYVEITVSDTGFGIDQNALQRIFEPFFSTKPKGAGTGLGLASAYATIKTHNGGIRVNSQLGEGTTFVILLPVSKSTESKNSFKETSTLYMGEGDVLLVDDNDWVRNSALQILEDLGYRVTGYGKSESALKYYREHWSNIDLVMLDLGISGIEISKVIEEIISINANSKILFMTGGDVSNFKKATNVKNDIRLLRKPYEVTVLSKIIQEMMSGHSEDDKS